jgi:hypothetical protein
VSEVPAATDDEELRLWRVESERREAERRRRLEEQRRLAQFGLTTDACHQINGATLAEYRLAPARGSAGGPGTYAYQGGLAELTVQLEDLGYERHDVQNVPIMVNRDRRIAVIFTSGNRFTGVRHIGTAPGTRYKKGHVLHQAIMRNRRARGQEELGEILSFEQLPTPSLDSASKIDQLLEGLSVHLYMIYFDWARKEIRSEVSHPASEQRSEFIDNWFDRAIVTPYPIPDDVPEGGPEIDFVIES